MPASLLTDRNGANLHGVLSCHDRIIMTGTLPGACCAGVYDKFSRVLRVEITVNAVSLFKHYRKVEHTQGAPSHELAPLKKTIYSLPDEFFAEFVISDSVRKRAQTT